MELKLCISDVKGVCTNCVYPYEVTATSSDELKKAVQFDHVCAVYKNHYRANDKFLSSQCIPMDCDNDHTDAPNEWVTPEALENEFADVKYAVTYSRNHMKVKGSVSARPRFHVYFEIPEMKDPDAYSKLKERISEEYPFFDAGALGAARFIFGCDGGDVIWHDGTTTIDKLIAKNNFGTSSAAIPAGARNSTLSRFAGRVVKRYGHGDDAYRIFMQEAEKCDPPLGQDELGRIWDSAGKFEKKVSSQSGYIPPSSFNAAVPSAPAGSLKPSDFSDIGQAKVLANVYGNELKFNPATDYLRYNGIFWEESKEAAVGACEEFLDLQLADAQLCVMLTQQDLLNSGLDPSIIKAGGKKVTATLSNSQYELYQRYLDAAAYAAFVMKRRDYKYIRSALDSARPMVSIDFEELDKNEFLLNTPFSTYDLRLGMAGRQEHSSEDLITKVTLTEPGDDGEDIWLDTLDKTFLGDKELIDYVQEVVGLAAVGKVYVEALIIAYGEGRNGKSTFWNSISKVLGTYSGNLSADTLTVGCKRNVKPEMAETKGKRLIIAAELDEGTRLNTSVVKQLCSTDRIFAEKKYKAPAAFTPSHTVVLYTNHLPRVGANDAGTWRRLIVIPFNAKYEGSADRKNFTETLVTQAGSAILKWIIEGACKVISRGFHISRPKLVTDAINEYHQKNDWLGMFLEDCCEADASYEEKSGELYQEYRSYTVRMGEFTRGNVDFYSALDLAGFGRRRKKTGNYIVGLRLKTAFAADDAEEDS